MAIRQIQGGNKTPQTDGQPGFGGGQVSNLRAALLQQNQCGQLVNMDLMKLEDAVTRRGTDQMQTGEAADATKPVLGMGYFDITGTEKLMRVRDVSGTLKVQTHDGTPASSWADAAGWTPANARCSIVQGNNKLFFGNGTDNLRSWDGAAFTDMGTTYPNPPKYAHLLYATNRLIGWGDTANPDTIGFSNILGEGVWSLANSLRVGAGDGDGIVACTLWSRTLLVVLKRSSANLIDINPATTVASMVIDDISKTVGCVGPRAFAKVGKDIWFVTDEGVRSLQRILQGEDTEISPPVSYPVQNVFDTVNRAAMDTICCAFYGDRFFMAIPTGSNTQPDTVLVARIMPDGPRWLGTWTGWTPTLFVRSYIAGAQRLNIGMADGRVLRWRDFVTESSEATTDYEDAGVAIASAALTRNLTFGDAGQWKQGFSIEAEFSESRAEVDVTPVLDGVEAAAPVITASSALGFLTFPISFPLTFPITGIRRTPGTLMHNGRFRELAVLVEAAAGKMALRSVTVTAFIKTMETSST